MFCQNCGAKNEKDSDFCYQCGARLAPQPQPATQASDQSSQPFQRQNLVVLVALAVAVLAIIALAVIAFRRPSTTIVITSEPGQSEPVQPNLSSSPTIYMLGQDGADYAVSGCVASGNLGSLGHIDNHIQISRMKNLEGLREVYVTYPGSHWHDPCNGDQEWQIVVIPSGEDLLDLYFESDTELSVSVTYTVTLQYSDGTEDVFTVEGSSGSW